MKLLKNRSLLIFLPFYKNGKLSSLKGFNTDAFGFQQLIKPYLKAHHTNALVLGSGGSSKQLFIF